MLTKQSQTLCRLQIAGVRPFPGHQVRHGEAVWRRGGREHDGILRRALPPVRPQRGDRRHHRDAPQGASESAHRTAEVPPRGQTPHSLTDSLTYSGGRDLVWWDLL